MFFGKCKLVCISGVAFLRYIRWNVVWIFLVWIFFCRLRVENFQSKMQLVKKSLPKIVRYFNQCSLRMIGSVGGRSPTPARSFFCASVRTIGSGPFVVLLSDYLMTFQTVSKQLPYPSSEALQTNFFALGTDFRTKKNKSRFQQKKLKSVNKIALYRRFHLQHRSNNRSWLQLCKIHFSKCSKHIFQIKKIKNIFFKIFKKKHFFSQNFQEYMLSLEEGGCVSTMISPPPCCSKSQSPIWSLFWLPHFFCIPKKCFAKFAL